MTSSTDHISFEVLADLAEERSPTASRESVLTHLQECSACGSSLDGLRGVIGMMRTDQSEDAPQAAIARALNTFQRQPLRETATPSMLRRLVASLSFDSLSAEPAFGFRSGQAATRQLIFSAEDIDLDLRIAPLGDRWNVSGQVLGTECGGGEVQMQSETANESAGLNDVCEFNLAPVTSGSYRLRLRLEDVEIEVPQLELGS